VVSITISPSERSNISILECHLLSIKTWSLLLCVFPSGELQVYIWMSWCGNMVLLTTKYFRCCQVYYSNSIVITNFMWTLIPDCRFENSYLLCLLSHWNHTTKFSYRTSGADQIHVLVPHRSSPLRHRSYPRMGVHTQNNNITPETSLYYINVTHSNKLI